MNNKMILWAATTLIAAMTSGCDPETGCTLIGCVGGISVSVVDGPTQTPVQTFTATITVGTLTGQFECPNDGSSSGGGIDGPSPCADNEIFLPLPVRTPESVSIEMSSPEGRFAGRLDVNWRREFPNGSQCDDGCLVGIAVIQLQ